MSLFNKNGVVQQERDDVKRELYRITIRRLSSHVANAVIDRIGFVLFAPLLMKKEGRYVKQAGFRKNYYNFASAQEN